MVDKFVAPVVRGAYSFDPDANSAAYGLECPEDESKTQQQFADEVNINTIVRRFGLTGELPDVVRIPVSGDFTGVTDFKSAMDVVANAQSAFMELPGALRARFENDPQRLMDFMSDEKNADEARTLGLVNPVPEVTRDVVRAVDDLAAKIVPVVDK